MSNLTSSFVTHPVNPAEVNPASANYGYRASSSYGYRASSSYGYPESSSYGYPESSSYGRGLPSNGWPYTSPKTLGSLKYAKPGNNPPVPPAITIPTVNGVPQTELPHMPPGYSYR